MMNNMLEDFNFDDVFVGFDHRDHVLPDLAEADLGAFSFDGDEEFEEDEENRDDHGNVAERENCKETVSPVEVSAVNSPSPESADKEGGKPKPKPGTHGKGSHGKRTVKVGWTPALHRRFVQAVEQLGIDKAVPSRILEIMGIGGLTRHNVASHLQKYRSHRKHLMAREAEAASWSQRRQTSSSVMHINPHPRVPLQHVPFRPLHVWGHPTWAPTHPPPPSTPWQLTPPHCPPRGPNAVTQGTPCFPRPVLPLPPVRFPPPLTVVGVPPHPLYGPDGTSAAVPGHPDDEKLRISQIQLLDAPPSKESIDAAIGDAIAKPWLPLPLGLKPPSLESVLAELCKQGVSIEPPTN